MESGDNITCWDFFGYAQYATYIFTVLLKRCSLSVMIVWDHFVSSSHTWTYIYGKIVKIMTLTTVLLSCIASILLRVEARCYRLIAPQVFMLPRPEKLISWEGRKYGEFRPAKVGFCLFVYNQVINWKQNIKNKEHGPLSVNAEQTEMEEIKDNRGQSILEDLCYWIFVSW